MQIKLIFIIKLCTWPHYEREGFSNSEVAGLFWSFLFFLPILAGPSPGILLPENAQMFCWNSLKRRTSNEEWGNFFIKIHLQQAYSYFSCIFLLLDMFDAVNHINDTHKFCI